jgi:hypothetical protein
MMDIELRRMLSELMTQQKDLIRKVHLMDLQIQSDYRETRDELRQICQTNDFKSKQIDERLLDLEGANQQKNYKTMNERNNNG